MGYKNHRYLIKKKPGTWWFLYPIFPIKNTHHFSPKQPEDVPRRGEASFHISLLMPGLANPAHQQAMDQHLGLVDWTLELWEKWLGF